MLLLYIIVMMSGIIPTYTNGIRYDSNGVDFSLMISSLHQVPEEKASEWIDSIMNVRDNNEQMVIGGRQESTRQSFYRLLHAQMSNEDLKYLVNKGAVSDALSNRHIMLATADDEDTLEFVRRGEIHYGVLDSVPSQYSDIVTVPMFVVPVSVVYSFSRFKLSEHRHLVLDLDIIRRILINEIVVWNDPSIVALNKGLSGVLSPTNITVVLPLEHSGIYFLLAEIVLGRKEAIARRIDGNSLFNFITFPSIIFVENVIDYVLRQSDTLGFVEALFKNHNGPNVLEAAIINRAGFIVPPSSGSVKASVSLLNNDFKKTLVSPAVVSAENPLAYPLVLWKYVALAIADLCYLEPLLRRLPNVQTPGDHIIGVQHSSLFKSVFNVIDALSCTRNGVLKKLSYESSFTINIFPGLSRLEVPLRFWHYVFDISYASPIVYDDEYSVVRHVFLAFLSKHNLGVRTHIMDRTSAFTTDVTMVPLVVVRQKLERVSDEFIVAPFEASSWSIASQWPELILSEELVVLIFSGIITFWNDTAIVTLNPTISFPTERIVVGSNFAVALTINHIFPSRFEAVLGENVTASVASTLPDWNSDLDYVALQKYPLIFSDSEYMSSLLKLTELSIVRVVPTGITINGAIAPSIENAQAWGLAAFSFVELDVMIRNTHAPSVIDGVAFYPFPLISFIVYSPSSLNRDTCDYIKAVMHSSYWLKGGLFSIPHCNNIEDDVTECKNAKISLDFFAWQNAQLGDFCVNGKMRNSFRKKKKSSSNGVILYVFSTIMGIFVLGCFIIYISIIIQKSLRKRVLHEIKHSGVVNLPMDFTRSFVCTDAAWTSLYDDTHPEILFAVKFLWDQRKRVIHRYGGMSTLTCFNFPCFTHASTCNDVNNVSKVDSLLIRALRLLLLDNIDYMHGSISPDNDVIETIAEMNLTINASTYIENIISNHTTATAVATGTTIESFKNERVFTEETPLNSYKSCSSRKGYKSGSSVFPIDIFLSQSSGNSANLSDAKLSLNVDPSNSESIKSNKVDQFECSNVSSGYLVPSVHSKDTVMDPDSVLINAYNKRLYRLLKSSRHWSFDLRDLHAHTNGCSLYYLATFWFDHFNLCRRFDIVYSHWISWLTAIQAAYNENNCFHNSMRAADVFQAFTFFIQTRGFGEHLMYTDLLASYIAILILYIDHPGISNNILIATAHPLAILYNDRYVLQNHHLYTGFSIMFRTNDSVITETTKAPPSAASLYQTTAEIRSSETLNCATGSFSCATKRHGIVGHLSDMPMNASTMALNPVVLLGMNNIEVNRASTSFSNDHISDDHVSEGSLNPPHDAMARREIPDPKSYIQFSLKSSKEDVPPSTAFKVWSSGSGSGSINCENISTSRSHRKLEDRGNMPFNILSSLDASEVADIRKRIILLVLSTDTSNALNVIQKFQQMYYDGKLSKISIEFLSMAFKVSEFAWCARSTADAYYWGASHVNECTNSNHFTSIDSKPNFVLAQAQIAFYDVLVTPAFYLWKERVDCHLPLMNLKTNLKFWKDMKKSINHLHCSV